MNHETAKERLFGIDLLRILAMYMVCILHSNDDAHMYLSPGHEPFFYFNTWIVSVSIIGVNLFAMITGYVCIHNQWKLERYINLWLSVAFYSIFLILAGILLTKLEVINWNYSFQSVLDIIISLPFGSKYWYFAAYTGLFFCIPFLNAALLKCSKVQFISLLFVLFIVIPFFNLKPNKTFITDGYNFTWLAFLYAGGAYIKRFQPKCNGIALVCLILFLPVIPLICRFIGTPAPLGYCHHNIILYTFCTFLLLYHIKGPKNKLLKITLFASHISFAVYLIHQHPVGVKLIEKAVHYILSNLDYPIWFALVVALCVYIACAPIEYFRIKLFQIFRVQALSKYSADIIEKIFQQIVKKISHKNNNSSLFSDRQTNH